MKAKHKLNNGNGTTLCNKCNIIINNKITNELYCDKCQPNIVVCKNYYGFNIEYAEKKYNAKYIGDFCVKDNYGSWSEKPASIFYTENPDTSKGHTHYFGLFCTYKINELGKSEIDKVLILKGDSAFETPFIGLQTKKGDILISCFRHHFNGTSEEFIDGGRDYQRYSTPAKFVKVEVKKDKLKIIE